MTNKSFFIGDNEDGMVHLMVHQPETLSISFQTRGMSGFFISSSTHISISDARRLHDALGEILPIAVEPVEEV